jgi:hypothetical protein
MSVYEDANPSMFTDSYEDEKVTANSDVNFVRPGLIQIPIRELKKREKFFFISCKSFNYICVYYVGTNESKCVQVFSTAWDLRVREPPLNYWPELTSWNRSLIRLVLSNRVGGNGVYGFLLTTGLGWNIRNIQ